MKHLHLLHIGYPKTGTTWLWNRLVEQPWFSAPGDKENASLIYGQPIKNYIKFYKNFEITGNFCVHNFGLDRYLIDNLSKIPTVNISLSLRNPYEFYWSFYNSLPDQKNISFDDFTKNFINQSWYNDTVKIIDRWKLKFKKRFKIYFYDDLKENALEYFETYLKDNCLENMPIAPILTESSNKTSYNPLKSKFLSPTVCDTLDKQIIKIQKNIDRDVQHWLDARKKFENHV